MKIQYTLPGFNPELATVNGTGEPVESLSPVRFRTRYRHDATSWQQVLNLERTAPGPTHVSPPRLPASLPAVDAAGQHSRWQAFLHRHATESVSRSNGQTSEKVDRMMALLVHSRRAAETIMLRSTTGGTV